VFFLFPISHEDMTARQWPWLTTLLVVACTALLLVLNVAMNAWGTQMEQVEQRVTAFEKAHPWLDPCARATAAPDDDDAKAPRDPELEAFLGRTRPKKAEPARPGPAVVARQQEELRGYCAELDAAKEAMPARTWGFVPTAGLAQRGTLTHAMLHGGWLHLIGNMWFLWLCGCNLEDRWGKVVFGLFYALAAAAGAAGHLLANPGSDVPLVGASGAIAGAMGAFLVVYGRTRIRFAYFYLVMFVPKAGTFRAPALFVLPLWLGLQVLWGLLGADDGVAYWAHVGGFVFGCGAAAVMRASGLDQRLDTAAEEAITTHQDPRVLRAGDLMDQSRWDEALRVLDPMAREQPDNLDVELGRLRAAKGASDRARESATYARLVELYLQHAMPDTAVELYAEAELHARLDGMSPATRARVGDHLAQKGHLSRASQAYAAAYPPGGPHDAESVRRLVAHARLLVDMGQRQDAQAILERGMTTPDLTGELQRLLAGERDRLA